MLQIAVKPSVHERLKTYDEAVEYLESLGVCEDKIADFSLVAGNRFTRSLLEQRLELLRGLGFPDPVKMIVTLPPILGYGEENIRGKLRYAERLKKWGVNPIKLIESFPPLIGYSMKRFFFCLRFIACLDDGEPSILITIITKKPDALAAALFTRGLPTWANVRPEINKKKNTSENEALIAAHRPEKMALSYFRYTGRR